MRAVTSGGVDLVAIRLRLLGKERPTRHGNDPRVYALRIEQPLRFERQRDFGPRRDQDEIRRPVRVGDNVGALFDRRATRAEERLRVRQGLSSRTQHWSVQPCVRPVDAVHMTAGHNALRGSGPGQKLAFVNALALVGCPDRRIDRLCITCCSPSQHSHHIECPMRSRSRRKRSGFFVASPLAIIAHAILAILLASAMAATFVGLRASNAVSQGQCLVNGFDSRGSQPRRLS